MTEQLNIQGVQKKQIVPFPKTVIIGPMMGYNNFSETGTIFFQTSLCEQHCHAYIKQQVYVFMFT